MHLWWWSSLVLNDVLYDPNVLITHEGAFSERFQYAKELWIALLCGLLAVREGPWSFGVWALLFGYILYDDSRVMHEQLGGRISYYVSDLAFPGAVSAQDIGELVVFFLFGLAFLPLLALAYWRSPPPLRTIHRRLLFLMSILVALAAGADFVHRLYELKWWDLVWGIIEDGGELIIMSIILWYVFRLATQSVTNTRSSSWSS